MPRGEADVTLPNAYEGWSDCIRLHETGWLESVHAERLIDSRHNWDRWTSNDMRRVTQRREYGRAVALVAPADVTLLERKSARS
jgi:hypothetical protein